VIRALGIDAGVGDGAGGGAPTDLPVVAELREEVAGGS